MDFLTFVFYYLVVDFVGSVIFLGLFYWRRDLILSHLRWRLRGWLGVEACRCPAPDCDEDGCDECGGDDDCGCDECGGDDECGCDCGGGCSGNCEGCSR